MHIIVKTAVAAALQGQLVNRIKQITDVVLEA